MNFRQMKGLWKLKKHWFNVRLINNVYCARIPIVEQVTFHIKQFNHITVKLFNNLKPVLLIILCALLFFSCKKESFNTSQNASLYTSRDTLFFDTVFTITGSITQSFKIFNNNDQKLQLSQVKLSGGSASPFKINIDGASATEVNLSLIHI